MNITILCVGQIEEKYFRDAIAEYQKASEPLLQIADDRSCR